MVAWIPPNDLDPECLVFCQTINAMPGLRTLGSCCGHGKSRYQIVVGPDGLESLPDLVYWLDVCHSGCTGWIMFVTTDCSAAPVKFIIEGPVGPSAYKDSKTIAGFIRDNVLATKKIS